MALVDDTAERVELVSGDGGGLFGLVWAEAEAVVAGSAERPPVPQESASAVLPLASSLPGSSHAEAGRQAIQVQFRLKLLAV